MEMSVAAAAAVAVAAGDELAPVTNFPGMGIRFHTAFTITIIIILDFRLQMQILSLRLFLAA